MWNDQFQLHRTNQFWCIFFFVSIYTVRLMKWRLFNIDRWCALECERVTLLHFKLKTDHHKIRLIIIVRMRAAWCFLAHKFTAFITRSRFVTQMKRWIKYWNCFNLKFVGYLAPFLIGCHSETKPFTQIAPQLGHPKKCDYSKKEQKIKIRFEVNLAT